MHYPIFFRVTQPVEVLGLWPGDVVRYDPTSSRTLELFRRLPPNHGALAGAVADGQLTPIDGDLLVNQLHRELPVEVPPRTPALRLIR